MKLRNVLVVVGLLLIQGAGCARPNAGGPRAGAPPLLVFNARVWTGNPSQPVADSFFVEDGRIREVGTGLGDDERIASVPGLRRMDANGARILPGLIDAHVHLIGGGLQLSRINLRDVPDRAAFVAAIAERGRATPKGEWILGGRWSTESWPDPAQPTREWIDAVTPDHPVLLSRMDGHGALANSVALKLAGIDAKGPADPPGGEIERDSATGEPTGILKDTAIDLVAARVPPPTDLELDLALKAAMAEAHRYGITSVHTMSAYAELAPIDRARDAGTLTLRVRFFISENDWRNYVDRAKAHRNDEFVRVCGFKQYADGSLGSRTAYMAEPFSDNPQEREDWRGLAREILLTEDGLLAMCKVADSNRFGSAVHAIGDKANQLVLNIYEVVKSKRPDWRINSYPQEHTPPPGGVLRIEHVQHLLAEDIKRLARLGVVASMQPLHKADDARYAEAAIGAERCKSSYAFRSLLDAGAHLAFGSDWPVVSINPFLGIHAAITALSLDGEVFVPEQKIKLEEALAAYTSGAAYAAGDELRLGQIAPGFAADFVILTNDILAMPPDAVRGVTVQSTYVDGRQVWPSP